MDLEHGHFLEEVCTSISKDRTELTLLVLLTNQKQSGKVFRDKKLQTLEKILSLRK